MTAYNGIRSTLRTFLLTTPGLPAAAHWQGESYTPTPGVAYFRERLNPAASTVATAGRSGYTREDWVYLVDLFCPPELYSITEAETLGDEIRKVFFVGRGISPFGLGGVVDMNNRGPARETPGWFLIPVTIEGWHYRPTQESP